MRLMRRSKKNVIIVSVQPGSANEMAHQYMDARPESKPGNNHVQYVKNVCHLKCVKCTTALREEERKKETNIERGEGRGHMGSTLDANLERAKGSAYRTCA